MVPACCPGPMGTPLFSLARPLQGARHARCVHAPCCSGLCDGLQGAQTFELPKGVGEGEVKTGRNKRQARLSIGKQDIALRAHAALLWRNLTRSTACPWRARLCRHPLTGCRVAP